MRRVFNAVVWRMDELVEYEVTEVEWRMADKFSSFLSTVAALTQHSSSADKPT